MSDVTASLDGLAEALEQSDGFQLLARSLPDALLVVRPDGEVAYASVQSRSFFGAEAGEIVGRPFLALVAEPDRRAFPDPVTASGVGTWDFRSAGSGRWLNAAFLHPGLQGLRGTKLHGALGDASLVLVRDLPPGEDGARDRTDLLRRALDATNNLIVVTDATVPDNPLSFVNDHFLAVTGYSREEVVGRNCRFLQVRPDGTRDDDQDGIRELTRAVEAGRSAHVIVRNYTKGGDLFYNELYISPVRDREGRVVNFVGVQNDVTERILAEREALTQSSLLRAFFDSAPVLMGVVQRDDAGLVHRTANEAAAGLYGRMPDEVAGSRPEELGFSAAEADRWRDAVAEVASTGRPVQFETRYPWGAGPFHEGVRHLRMTVSRVEGQGTSEQGELYSYLGEDVSVQVRVERERKLLVAAVDAAAESILVTDAALEEPGPRILYVNEAHRRIFGYEPGELLGRSPRIFQGPKTDRAVLDRVRARLAAGDPVAAETVNYRADGSEFILQWEIAPVKDEAGAVVNWVGTQRDVTERRRLEREILEISAREQERMAQDLHDGLGQVLTGVTFRLQALRTVLEGRGDPELAADADRSRLLVVEALEQARAIARGLFPVNVEPDGLMLALERLADDAAAAFGIECTFDFDAPVPLRSNEAAGHLYRIAQEALANAARHGKAAAVHISLSHDRDGAVTLAVQDDGVGIPDAAFTGGEGLGLRTMRYRAERVGGGLEVRPLDGGGTLVTVTFEPAAPPDP